MVAKAKAKSNVLDKKRTGSGSGGGGGASGGKGGDSMDASPPASPLPPSGMTAGQAQKMEELINEVNKLKAIVLKHEVRIRDLEKKVDAGGGGVSENGDGEGAAKNNGDAAH